MKNNRHPYAGLTKRLTVSADVEKYVAGLKELPTVPHEERVKPYWKEQGLRVKGKDGKDLGLGVVPAGDYTDPSTKEAKAALAGLYRALKGQPISRHLAAVALNFQVSDDVDEVRAALKADGVKDIDPGDRGRSVRMIGDKATWAPPKKAAAEKAPAKTPAKKAAAKNGGNGTKAPAKAPAKAAAPTPEAPAPEAPAPVTEPAPESISAAG
jgi:hypothetical protein